MFTGIIKEIGKITKIEESSNGKIIAIQAPVLTKDLKVGDSISVNGCCLTVKKFASDCFFADISFTTLKSTTFKNIKVNDFVNLEDSIKLTDKLGGHFVTGHIDDIGSLVKIEKLGNFYSLIVKVEKNILKFIAPKGSIAVDGISLTVVNTYEDLSLNSSLDSNFNKDSGYFSITVIPHTFENTTLKYKKINSLLNIEVDILARYVENLLNFTNKNITKANNNNNYNNNYNEDNNDDNHNNKLNKDNRLINNNDKILEDKLKKYGFIK